MKKGWNEWMICPASDICWVLRHCWLGITYSWNLSLAVLFHNQWKRKTEGNWITLVHVEKVHYIRGCEMAVVLEWFHHCTLCCAVWRTESWRLGDSVEGERLWVAETWPSHHRSSCSSAGDSRPRRHLWESCKSVEQVTSRWRLRE